MTPEALCLRSLKIRCYCDRCVVILRYSWLVAGALCVGCWGLVYLAARAGGLW